MKNRTSSIKHHLSDQLLMAYAAGSLPEAFSLVVATHVSLCDECRARAEAYEAVGGAVTVDLQLLRNGSMNASQVALLAGAFGGSGGE